MIKAHKIRLNPTPEQAKYFARAAGTSRFVWNWALAETEEFTMPAKERFWRDKEECLSPTQNQASKKN